MKRRDFISALGAAAAWPLTARAQPARHHAVGFLANGTPQAFAPDVAGFLEGLKEAGFVDGRNLKIEYRWSEGQLERLPGLAAELAGRPVDVLATAGGNVSAVAAKQATSAVPIVFVTAADPVATGLVASLNRPGGNVTGVTWLGVDVLGKNMELMHELLPAVSVIGVLMNPKNTIVETQMKNARAAASATGKTIRALHASSDREIDAAFDTVAAERIGALLIATDPMFNIHRKRIVGLAARHAVPAVYFFRQFVADGGLMSYGSGVTEAYKVSGGYVGRILKGARPADLPVQQTTKVELVINLKTAKSLGLTFPNTLLGRADEVFE